MCKYNNNIISMYLSLLILSIDGTLLLLFDVSLVVVGGISGGDLSIGGVG